METGVSLVQRMQEDAEFRQNLNACANGVERLALLKIEGYDFTRFIQIWDNLSSRQPSAGGLGQPGERASHRQALQVFGAGSAKYSVPRKPPPGLVASLTESGAADPQVAHLFEGWKTGTIFGGAS